MARVMKNSWTDEDVAKLRAYADDGRSVYRIAAAFNRSVSAVRSVAQRNGISIKSQEA
jgi:hypothetical protein